MFLTFEDGFHFSRPFVADISFTVDNLCALWVHTCGRARIRVSAVEFPLGRNAAQFCPFSIRSHFGFRFDGLVLMYKFWLWVDPPRTNLLSACSVSRGRQQDANYACPLFHWCTIPTLMYPGLRDCALGRHRQYNFQYMTMPILCLNFPSLYFSWTCIFQCSSLVVCLLLFFPLF